MENRYYKQREKNQGLNKPSEDYKILGRTVNCRNQYYEFRKCAEGCYSDQSPCKSDVLLALIAELFKSFCDKSKESDTEEYYTYQCENTENKSKYNDEIPGAAGKVDPGRDPCKEIVTFVIQGLCNACDQIAVFSGDRSFDRGG